MASRRRIEAYERKLAKIATEWRDLVNPRPLTPAEYAEHGIPEPCTHAADEETTQRAEGATP